jgi:hypothetical protein
LFLHFLNIKSYTPGRSVYDQTGEAESETGVRSSGGGGGGSGARTQEEFAEALFREFFGGHPMGTYLYARKTYYISFFWVCQDSNFLGQVAHSTADGHIVLVVMRAARYFVLE